MTRPGGADGHEARRAEFAAFVAEHARGLNRLGFLMLSDRHAAEDVAADALLSAWQNWERVRAADNPLAYVRRILVNAAMERHRRRTREVTLVHRLELMTSGSTDDPDGAVTVDVRAALLRLPPRRRACLVLRHAFDLSEEDVAQTLGISVGTVKSQTSKALVQFKAEVGDRAALTRRLVPAPTKPAARRTPGHA